MKKPKKEWTLSVCNPSNYQRSGVVEVNWHDEVDAAHPAPERVTVTANGHPLVAQIERIDPEDHTQDLLVFRIENLRGPEGGDADYTRGSTTVVVADDGDEVDGPPLIDAIENGLKVVNGVLDAFLHYKAWFGTANWFGGAWSSIQFGGTEFLDSNYAVNHWLRPPGVPHWEGQDPQKRLQVDSIRINHPPWDAVPYDDVSMFNRDFALLHDAKGKPVLTNGPVRSSVTIRSAPFTMKLSHEHEAKPVSYSCWLYRVIRTTVGADSIDELLFLKAKREGVKPIHLTFAARWFLWMDLGLRTHRTHYPAVPDWFALAGRFEPFPGYAFATNVHAGFIWNPPIALPPREGDDGRRAFAWELGPGKRVHCLHTFRLKARVPQELDDEAGLRWYERVYKPLRLVAKAP